MTRFITGILLLFSFTSPAQINLPKSSSEMAKKWVDSIYNALTPEERIAQCMVVRLSTIDSKTRQVTLYDKEVGEYVRKFNIGGICVFQGGPVQQADIINRLQQDAKVPLLVTIDAEWGLGMRLLDSVVSLPRQMMLGAIKDTQIVYEYGRVVAEQCKRFGVHLNFAPVIDINNNPANPVINDRSFGEDKKRVTLLGRQYVNGLQDEGIMACLKHFPGHGDVTADSHTDLPIINKSIDQLDSLELVPFNTLFNEGAASVMVGHLHIPAIDTTSYMATSLSKNNVKGLLFDKMGFKGLSFTDALDMQAVKKFFPGGKAALQAMKAGNDMLLLPEDVPGGIALILEAMKKGEISDAEVEGHCKKILEAKYTHEVNKWRPIETANLSRDLNLAAWNLKKIIADNAITLLSANNQDFFPLSRCQEGSIAYLGIGINKENLFARRVKEKYNADLFYFDAASRNDTTANEILEKLRKYDKVILGIHNISRRPKDNFGIGDIAKSLMGKLSAMPSTMTYLFGNAYAAANLCEAANLAICYEDDSIVQNAAFQCLSGNSTYKGILPVSVCPSYQYGSGIETPLQGRMADASINKIDSIVYDAIRQKAFPGCVILISKDGKIQLHKAYGNYSYERANPATTESVYDLASLTKIFATTLAIMKLKEQGKLELKKKISHYLPESKGTDKAAITVQKLLLHEAGLVPFIEFYKEAIDSTGKFKPGNYETTPRDSFKLRVAENLYARSDMENIILKRILASPLQTPGKYVYSDNDFLLLGMIAERIAGMPLEDYLAIEFYGPMGLGNIGFHPLERLPKETIIPTQYDSTFRHQLLKGDVHDPGAALLGGKAGHAGLFATAYELDVILQMLLNGGTFESKRYLNEKTIRQFTAYQSKISRRGLGFDKPEKDNANRKDPYPALQASPLTFGHTGFTGTCSWADPATGLVFIFLSNRIHPNGNDALIKLSIRRKILEEAYKGFEKQ